MLLLRNASCVRFCELQVFLGLFDRLVPHNILQPIERLAEILHEIVRDDPQLRRRVREALQETPRARTEPAAVMVGSIERRLAVLEEMDGYRDTMPHIST